MRLTLILLLGILCAPLLADDSPLNIGSRRELFVDTSLFDSIAGKAELKLHHPAPQEIAFQFDRPWEGSASGYPTVFQDGDLYRMYYRGHRYILDPPPLRQARSPPRTGCARALGLRLRAARPRPGQGVNR